MLDLNRDHKEFWDTYIKVYDVAEKKVIEGYETSRKASTELGVSLKIVNTSHQKKKKFYSPKLKKEVACRLAKRTPDMEFIAGILKNKELIMAS